MDKKTKKLMKELLPHPSNIAKDAIITAGAVGTVKKMKDSLNEGAPDNIEDMSKKQTFNNGVYKLAAENTNKDDKMKYVGLATGIGLAGAGALYGLKTGKINTSDIVNPAKKFAKKVSPAYKGFTNIVGIANSRKNKNKEMAKLKDMFGQYNPGTTKPLNFDGFREMYEMYKSENKVINNPNAGNVDDFLNYIKTNSNKYFNNKQREGMRNFQEQASREGKPFGINIDKKKLEKNILTGMGLLADAAVINTGIKASSTLYDKVMKKDDEFKVDENMQQAMRTEARKILSQEYKNQQRNQYKKRNNLKYSKVKGIDKQAKIITKDFLKQNIAGNTLNSMVYTGTSLATAGVINKMVNGKPKREENKNGNTAIIDIPEKAFNKMLTRKSKKVLDKEIEKKAYDYSNVRKKIKKNLNKVLPEDMPKQLTENAFRGVTRTAPIALATSLAAKRNIDVSTKTGVTKKKEDMDPLEPFDPVQQGSIRIMIQKPKNSKEK